MYTDYTKQQRHGPREYGINCIVLGKPLRRWEEGDWSGVREWHKSKVEAMRDLVLYLKNDRRVNSCGVLYRMDFREIRPRTSKKAWGAKWPNQ